MKTYIDSRVWWLGAALLSALLPACSGPAQETENLPMPDPMTFPMVSDALEVRCGTADCHGEINRNMRLYGIYGIRASSANVTGDMATTPQEYANNYQSVTSIEPEKLSDIFTHHGQGFDKWIVVTKGTGAEHHKGGSRFTKGDPTYQCLLSWVQGALNMDACVAAAGIEPPGGDMF